MNVSALFDLLRSYFVILLHFLVLNDSFIFSLLYLFLSLPLHVFIILLIIVFLVCFSSCLLLSILVSLASIVVVSLFFQELELMIRFYLERCL